jgi:polysaccharide deacetylase family protein (PEP-CTERM system associated)
MCRNGRRFALARRLAEGFLMITNVLSVDVEEYYHAAIFRRGTNAPGPGALESRVERSVDELLAIMSEHGARATFFVLGEVAARHPEMVRTIARAGHEIGCHGDRHENVDVMTPEQFRADIRQAKARIEDAVDGAVIGYRAPNFSIGRTQSWAFRILLEEGFRYDSSTHPILHDRYGQPGAPRFPYVVYDDGSDCLVEFPIGTVRLLGVNLPIGGGGYFRLSPFALTRLGIDRVNAVERRPVMFYLHPWELDPGQPRHPLAWHNRFRLYVGLEKEAAKLSALLGHFRFAPACEVLPSQGQPARRLSPAPFAAAEAGSL